MVKATQEIFITMSRAWRIFYFLLLVAGVFPDWPNLVGELGHGVLIPNQLADA